MSFCCGTHTNTTQKCPSFRAKQKGHFSSLFECISITHMLQINLRLLCRLYFFLQSSVCVSCYSRVCFNRQPRTTWSGLFSSSGWIMTLLIMLLVHLLLLPSWYTIWQPIRPTQPIQPIQLIQFIPLFQLCQLPNDLALLWQFVNSSSKSWRKFCSSSSISITCALILAYARAYAKVPSLIKLFCFFFQFYLTCNSVQLEIQRWFVFYEIKWQKWLFILNRIAGDVYDSVQSFE